MNPIFRKHFSQIGEGMTLLDEDELHAAIAALRLTKQNGGTVYIFGNGGSHATASHFANDLMKMTRTKAICIGDSVPTVSAYGNDEGHGHMFSMPLETLIKPFDCAVGISCSGNSENVIKGLLMTRVRGGITIGLTGLSNSSLINKMDMDALIHARVPDIRVQEDLHSIVCHAIVRSLQEEQ